MSPQSETPVTATMSKIIATIQRNVLPLLLVIRSISLNAVLCHIYLAPHRGRARYCNAHVCLSVCLFVCLCVCLSVFSQNFNV